MICAFFLAADVVPPASQGVPNSSDGVQNLNGTYTDFASIVTSIDNVSQQSGAGDTAPPDQPVPGTTVTSIDGQPVDISVSSFANTTTPSRRAVKKRVEDEYGYEEVFGGTGYAGLSGITDASIEGTAYLTYTVVPNSTYNVEECLRFCTSVPGCGMSISSIVKKTALTRWYLVFANLYYEFNNELLDFVFSQHSNLKCAVYADIHDAAEKTNFGGQPSYPQPGPLTYIQDSSGWAASSLINPSDPPGYQLVFGPTNGANNAPGVSGLFYRPP